MDDFAAFLRWNSGDLLEDHRREAYAEWLVHQALAIDPGDHRIERAEIVSGDEGFSLAVKSAAYVQSRQQKNPGVISFQIETRSASIHIFCLLTERDPERANPRDRSQWRFWVVPTATLNVDRRSIGLQPLIRAHGEGIGFDALPGRVQHLRDALRSRFSTSGAPGP